MTTKIYNVEQLAILLNVCEGTVYRYLRDLNISPVSMEKVPKGRKGRKSKRFYPKSIVPKLEQVQKEEAEKKRKGWEKMKESRKNGNGQEGQMPMPKVSEVKKCAHLFMPYSYRKTNNPSLGMSRYEAIEVFCMRCGEKMLFETAFKGSLLKQDKSDAEDKEKRSA